MRIEEAKNSRRRLKEDVGKTKYSVPFHAMVDVDIEASSPEEALEIAYNMKDKEYSIDDYSAMFSHDIFLFNPTTSVYCDGELCYEE